MVARIWMFMAAIAAMAACGAKTPPSSNRELEEGATERAESAQRGAESTPAEAPPGKGVRKGTIDRNKLIAVLRKGPGSFLGQLEVSPRLERKRFVGWQFVRLLDRNSPLGDIDLAPGDVLVAVNGNSLSRPEQLQTLWDSLRAANSLDATLWRGTAKVQLAFAIEPPATR